MDKRNLSERDICTKFITPAIRRAGWDEMLQVREEVSFTQERIIVRGKLVARGQGKRADYVLYFKPNIPLAVIEAKDNSHSVGDGMQQALDYAETLNVPFAFSSNGDGFVFHDRAGTGTLREASLSLDEFPPPTELWARYRAWKSLTPEAEKIVLQDYHDDGSGKTPRYYQANAVNAATEAIAKGLPLNVLIDELDNNLDPFDLICHVAFDAKPLSRRERADKVRKRDVFAKHGDQARAVLNALLDKYADEELFNLDDANVLRIPPIDRLGTPLELVRAFGGRPGFERAVHDLQFALYRETA